MVDVRAMDMSDTGGQMVQCWQCMSCNKSLEDLVVLPCAHHFCSTCVVSWIDIYVGHYWQGVGEPCGRYPCQSCMVLYDVPPGGGLQTMVQNFYMVQLSQQMNSMGVTPPTPTQPFEASTGWLVKDEMENNNTQDPTISNNMDMAVAEQQNNNNSKSLDLKHYESAYAPLWGYCFSGISCRNAAHINP